MKTKIKKSDSISVRLAKKKFYNSFKRKGKAYSKVERNLNNPEKGKVNYYKSKIKFTNDIERFCSLNNLNSWASESSVINFDSDFSLSKNTDRVLKDLLILIRHAKTLSQSPRLSFKGHVSFGALYLIDTLCWEIGNRRKWVVKHPDLPEEEIKILKSLKSNISSSLEDESKYLINEKVRINRKSGEDSNQPYYAKAKEITDMLQKAIGTSLGNYEYSLEFDISQAINSTIGEQFDNILLHAIDTELGTLCAFFNKVKGEISILIFNFGPTIFQSLLYSELPMEIKSLIAKLKVNFGFTESDDIKKIKNNHTIESIYMVLSLQEGISSKLIEDKSRGHGLIDFIGTVKKLNQNSLITIISGNTAIYINNQTEITESFLIDRNRKQITLNSSGKLNDSPNPNNIKNLKYFFPGVLIETIIPLSDLTLN